MEIKPKRPVSIWIAQILLAIFVLFMVFSAGLTALILAGSRSAAALGLLIPILICLGLGSLFFFGFWGMAKRRTYGRWLGVAGLSVCLLFSLVAQLFPVDGPMQRYEYKNGAERFGGFIGGAIVFGLFLWLILHIALSKRVTEFFSPVTSTEIGEPPPPPTFDD